MSNSISREKSKTTLFQNWRFLKRMPRNDVLVRNALRNRIYRRGTLQKTYNRLPLNPKSTDIFGENSKNKDHI